MNNIPFDYRYDLNQHLWFKEEGSIILVGITDYAQEQLGELLFIELPEPGEYQDGDFLFSIESGKKDQDINAPLELRVVEVNSELEEEPERINENPYENWILKIETDSLDSLGDAEGYAEIIKE